MPDPLLYLQAVSVAGASTALVLVFVAFITRSARAASGADITRSVMATRESRPPPANTSSVNATGVLGAGLGLAVGFRLLSLPLAWPPTNALGRLLTVVLPAAICIELLASRERCPRWLSWSFRGGLAWAIARVLLHGSVYLTGGQFAWTGWQAGLAFALSGALLLAEWALLAMLYARSPGVSLPLALAQACLAAGLCVMLAGYVAGGEAALPLAATLIGAAIAAIRLPGGAPPGTIGIGVVGFFGLLFIGRFFGGLSTTQAVTIFLAPLLCWVTEIGCLRGRPRWLVGSLRLAVVAVPLIVVLVLAKRDFDRDTAPLISATGRGVLNVRRHPAATSTYTLSADFSSTNSRIISW
jgi:hypothetical protein